MKILLVYPRWDYPTFGQLQEPLGLLYIGAMLEKGGHEVRMVDLAVDGIEEVDRGIVGAGMVGISSSTVLFGRACRVLDRIKDARPELPVILGGPHATVMPEEAVSRGFDAVVMGEGERTALELADCMENRRPCCGIPGVVSRWEDGIHKSPARPFEPDLDSFPDPDRTLANYDGYIKSGLTNVGMMASRGCPFNCLFCKPMQDKLFGRKVRRRSVARIAAEMGWIMRNLGQRRFIFKDDTLILAGVDWFVDFERELKNLGINPSWSCQARVDQINRDLLLQMKRCGLEGMAFGVESGSQKILDFYRKGIRVEQTEEAFRLCHELEVGTHAFIMLGAPPETKDDLAATVDLVRRIKTNSVSVSITTPAPGSALYDYAVEAGIYNLKNPEDADYLFNRVPLLLPHLTVQDLYAAEQAILDLVPGTYFLDQLQQRVKVLAEATA